MIRREELVEIGVYNKPHGVNGEISASVDCEMELLRRFSCFVSNIDGIFVPFFVEAIRKKSHQSALLQIEGIASEKDAAMLVNKSIFVKKDEFNALADEYDSDEMPIDYFIGYKAIVNGKALGEIVDFDDSTANVLFTIRDAQSGKHVLVPAVEDFISGILPEQQQIEFEVPEELLNL